MYTTVKQPAGAAIRPILTGTPKQLEIAVTHRKQNVELISNRDTNTTPSNAFSRSNLAGFSQRRPSRAPISNQQSLSPSLPFRARHTPFLIVSPKRLEIAVSHRKQNTEVISNRMKIDPFRNVIERLCGRSAQECNERQNREQDARATKGTADSSRHPRRMPFGMTPKSKREAPFETPFKAQGDQGSQGKDSCGEWLD